jgi:hypothetical protein
MVSVSVDAVVTSDTSLTALTPPTPLTLAPAVLILAPAALESEDDSFGTGDPLRVRVLADAVAGT